MNNISRKFISLPRSEPARMHNRPKMSPSSNSKMRKPPSKVLFPKYDPGFTILFGKEPIEFPADHPKRRAFGSAQSLGIFGYSGQRRKMSHFSTGNKYDPKYNIGLSDRFEVIKTIGSGSFSEVYQVMHEETKLVFAMKKYEKRDVKIASQVKYYELFDGIHSYFGYQQNDYSDLDLATSVFIVEPVFGFIDLGFIHIGLEYVEGENLDTLQQRKISTGGIFSDDELWSILVDVLLALRFIHRHGYVHLDIKPSNIIRMATPSGIYIHKLCDFELISKVGSEVDTEGDWKYIAPEYLNHHVFSYPMASTEGDVWSLGETMYELASLSDIPRNGAGFHLIRSVTEVDELDYRGVDRSPELRQVIKMMLLEDPTKRVTVDYLLNEVYIITSIAQQKVEAAFELYRGRRDSIVEAFGNDIDFSKVILRYQNNNRRSLLTAKKRKLLSGSRNIFNQGCTRGLDDDSSGSSDSEFDFRGEDSFVGDSSDDSGGLFMDDDSDGI